MSYPLVSVICLCYNHERFVKESILSVIKQTHPHVQLIVVDDKSSDGSVSVIESLVKKFPTIQFISLSTNLGNCKAFNLGLRQSKGDFIIDLAADDRLRPDRIEKGLEAFRQSSEQTGVNFSDAVLMDAEGVEAGLHSHRFPHASVPTGDLYKDLLGRYFINSPTMMIRREVMERLGGYDESLAYEDFDFWVRSSRSFEYCYTPEPLVEIRVMATSMGRNQYKRGSRQMRSTLEVCKKALLLNKTSGEHAALRKRILYELRQAVRYQHFGLAWDYCRLWWRVP